MTITPEHLHERPIGVSDALHSLKPKAKWSVHNDDINAINWYEENEDDCPTKEQLEVEIARLQNEKNSVKYQSERKLEYPPLSDFADAYYWAQKGDNVKMDEYIKKCDDVKSKYPKPSS